MRSLKDIAISKATLAPSQNSHSILPQMFKWRVEEIFEGKNQIVIADPLEAFWWNRPLASDALCKRETDGLYSYNLPFIHKAKPELQFKTNYNILVNKNSVCVGVHLQLDDTWTGSQKAQLSKMLYTCIEDTLIRLGVKKDDLSHKGNDLYFKGVKFSGEEQLLKENVFTQDTVITLKYTPEKDIFARLTGQYALKKPITGIAENVPSITKEAFINTLFEVLQAYIIEHFN